MTLFTSSQGLAFIAAGVELPIWAEFALSPKEGASMSMGKLMRWPLPSHSLLDRTSVSSRTRRGSLTVNASVMIAGPAVSWMTLDADDSVSSKHFNKF